MAPAKELIPEALMSCPLSRRERARVRGLGLNRGCKVLTLTLSHGERQPEDSVPQ